MKQVVKYLKICANLFTAFLVLVFLFFVFPKILVFFMPFVIGYIISMIANPLVKFLEKRMKIVRKHSSMIIIIGVLAGVILLSYLAISKMIEETVKLVANLPLIYHDLSMEFTEIWQNLQIVIDRLSPEMQESINHVTADITSYISNIVQAVSLPTFAAASNFARNVPGTLIAIIMSILSAYFFTAERVRIMDALERYMPVTIKSNVSYVLGDLKRVVGGYFKAQLKIMVIVYLILLIGLLILKVNYAFVVGFFISFLDMLPFFGTGTVLIPWAILKILSGDLTMAIGLVVLYAVSQMIRQIIQPKIVGDTIGMDPLAALVFMYIGYKFQGVTGMIIAVPLGMITINLYHSGIFNNQIRCIKELVHDFNQFRKL